MGRGSVAPSTFQMLHSTRPGGMGMMSSTPTPTTTPMLTPTLATASDSPEP